MDDSTQISDFFVQYSKDYLLKLLIDYKLVAYQFQNLPNNESLDFSKPTNAIKLIDIVICSNSQCLVFKQVDYSIIADIFNKLKEEKVFIVNANVDLDKNNDNMTNEQKEIYNFCSFFKEEIKQNQFVKSTIAPISAFIIRRFFFPTNIFIVKQFFNYKNKNEKKTNLLNRLSKLLNSYKDTDIFLDERLQLLIKAINENKDDTNNYQIENFKEKDFIVLRTILQTEKFFFNLVIHIESLYIFLMKKSTKNKYSSEMDHEIEFCKKYSNRCITPFYGFLKKENDDDEIIGFIYEFMCNGTLENYIYSNNDIDEMYLLMAIRRIAEGIDYLHSNSLIHRDLKPDNILIDHDFMPYVSDFNVIKKNNNSSGFVLMSNDCGSVAYASPEQSSGESISYSTDIYSFGLIIYFLFTKKHFKLNNDLNSIKKIPKTLQYLFIKCIKSSAKERPDIKEILRIINEEIKSLYSYRNKIVNEIKISDTNYFYERILSNQNNLENIDLFDDIFDFQFKLLSGEKYKNPFYLEAIGISYFYGKTVNQDYLKAKKFLELSFKQNNSYGSFLLGKMYFEGLGVSKSYLKAITKMNVHLIN